MQKYHFRNEIIRLPALMQMNDILYSLSSPFTKAANVGTPAPVSMCCKWLAVDKFDITTQWLPSVYIQQFVRFRCSKRSVHVLQNDPSFQ